MFTDTYITGSCTINNGMVHKNGQMIHQSDVAGLQDVLLSIYQQFKFSYPKFYKMDNLSKLGWLAAEILLQNNALSNSYEPEEIGLILANSNSSLDNDLKYYQTIRDIPSPSVFVYTLPNIVIGEICIRNNFKGEQAFFIQEKFDADFIYKQVHYLLDQDILQACICGWVDVLGENYKAALFLIEKHKADNAVLFSADNMDVIYNKN